jgi:hypothetical protein
LGRDRTTSFMQVQIVCPSVPSPDLAPRISFSSPDSIEYSAEEIGLRQFQ